MAKTHKKEQVIEGVIDFLKSSHEGLIPKVVDKLREEVRRDSKLKLATVTTTTGFSESQKELISRKLEELTGREITIREIVDKKLLGGFKIRLGDWLYDSSIKGQLESLKEQIYAQS